MNVPAAMAEYMQAGGLGKEALRASGELPLVFDEQLRVRLVPLPGGAIVLESRVRPLPEEPRERERLLERALGLSFGRMHEHGEAPVLGDDREALRLQTWVASGASRADLEGRLESHLNALAFWRGALA